MRSGIGGGSIDPSNFVPLLDSAGGIEGERAGNELDPARTLPSCTASIVEPCACSALLAAALVFASAIRLLNVLLFWAPQASLSKSLSLILRPVACAAFDVEALSPCVFSHTSRSFLSSLLALGFLLSQFAFHIKTHSVYLFSNACRLPPADRPCSVSFLRRRSSFKPSKCG